MGFAEMLVMDSMPEMGLFKLEIRLCVKSNQGLGERDNGDSRQ